MLAIRRISDSSRNLAVGAPTLRGAYLVSQFDDGIPNLQSCSRVWRIREFLEIAQHCESWGLESMLLRGVGGTKTHEWLVRFHSNLQQRRLPCSVEYLLDADSCHFAVECSGTLWSLFGDFPLEEWQDYALKLDPATATVSRFLSHSAYRDFPALFSPIGNDETLEVIELLLGGALATHAALVPDGVNFIETLSRSPICTVFPGEVAMTELDACGEGRTVAEMMTA